MNILLVGCGKMGGALLTRWRELGLYTDIQIVEPAGTVDGPVNSPADLPEGFHPDVIVFAVKPQVLGDIILEYQPFAEDGALILSIVAGKPIAFFEEHLGGKAKIVRCMPNTPAAIGRGVTVAHYSRNVSPYEKDAAAKLMGAVGDFIWVPDEKTLDPVTALSGSGPAYVFLLVEALTAAGVKIGLDAALAERLARQTVIGSAALVEASPDTSASELRRNVTSPGGTTEAALNVLLADNGMLRLFRDALTAAHERAQELSK